MTLRRGMILLNQYHVRTAEAMSARNIWTHITRHANWYIGNWFVLWRGEELETFCHERGQVVSVDRDVVQDVLDCDSKLGKGRVEPVACYLPPQELPEPLDQVQIGGIGWQIEQLDSQRFGGFGDSTSVVIGRIVEYDQQPLAGVRGTSDTGLITNGASVTTGFIHQLRIAYFRRLLVKIDL